MAMAIDGVISVSRREEMIDVFFAVFFSTLYYYSLALIDYLLRAF